MTDAKRKELKARIDAGEARNDNRTRANMLDRAGERAIEAKDTVGAFIRRHPLATVAGGLVIGILVSGLFKRSPTRKLGEKAAVKAAGLATIGAELALTYAQQAMKAANDAGRSGADRIGDLGDTLGHTARNLAERAVDASESARTAGHGAARRITRAVRNRIH